MRVDPLRTLQDVILQVGDFAGVCSTPEWRAPLGIFPRLRIAHLPGEFIDQCINARGRKFTRSQFLPAIEPLLPEIDVVIEAPPPALVEEIRPAGIIPTARIGIATVG